MEPINFEQANFTWKGDGKEVMDLPAYRDETQTISLWKLSWRERLKLLWTGKLWHWTFSGKVFVPTLITTETPFEEVIR